MTAAYAFSLAAVVIATLAYRFGCRYLLHRAAQLTDVTRMDALEKALAEHKQLHEKAIKNLVIETRDSLKEVKTKASIALESSKGSNIRRFGR